MQLGSTHKNRKTDLVSPFLVSFHPEGGNLIATLSNKLFIKVNRNSDEIVDLKGEIVDENNHVVADVVPFGSGFMSVIFTPKPSQSYRLKTENGDLYPLPKIQASDYVINVNNLDPSVLSIRIQATTEFVNSKLWLKGEMSGVTYFKKELEFQKSLMDLNVPMQGIPSGVLTVSLNDKDR